MYSIGIIGATGAVGTEMLRVLETRNFPISELRLFASANSAGKSLVFRGKQYEVKATDEHSFDGLDIALFSAGGDISRAWRKQCVASGAIMIDNSSAFRMEPGVPLVIPEINADDLREHRGVIAVPNCSTIVMLMAVAPLRKFGKIKRIVVSTYQAVSGAGAKAMLELEQQTIQHLQKETLHTNIFPHPIAFNLFPHNTLINEHGYNGEEWKMIQETKKILHDDNIAVTATCIRVPVFRAHSESINIEYEPTPFQGGGRQHDRSCGWSRPPVEAIRDALANFPGVKLVDDREQNHFPMPNEAAGQFDVLAGHIRHDASNPNAIDLFVSGDQLLKGAALDAVQIAESLIEQKII